MNTCPALATYARLSKTAQEAAKAALRAKLRAEQCRSRFDFDGQRATVTDVQRVVVTDGGFEVTRKPE